MKVLSNTPSIEVQGTPEAPVIVIKALVAGQTVRWCSDRKKSVRVQSQSELTLKINARALLEGQAAVRCLFSQSRRATSQSGAILVSREHAVVEEID